MSTPSDPLTPPPSGVSPAEPSSAAATPSPSLPNAPAPGAQQARASATNHPNSTFDPSGEEKGGEKGEEKKLLRSSAIMAAGTIVSRITGYCRDTLVILAAIGNYNMGDAFRVSQTLPTVLYVLLAGGVLNAVFVPQIVRAMKHHDDGGDSYIDRLLTLTGMVLIVVSVVLTLSAPLLVPLWVDWDAPADIRIVVLLTYWSMPQIFFYGYITVLSQVLNAKGMFGPMMWAPILSNLVVIASGLLFIVLIDDIDKSDPTTLPSLGILLLGGGSLLGVIVQTLALIPPLYRSGYRYRPRFNFRGFGLRKTGNLAKWTLLFVFTNQISNLIIVRVGTKITEIAQQMHGEAIGYGYSAYNNAYMIFILPHSIVTVSLVTALLPRMSSSAIDGQLGQLRNQISQGLRLSAILIIPASVAFLFLGPELGRMLAFPAGVEGATYVGHIVSAFGPGLLAFTANYLLLRGFYAQEDTRTPFFLNVVICAVNIVGVYAAFEFLPVRWAAVGMAAAFSLSYAVGALGSFLVLRRRLGNLDARRVMATFGKLLLASLIAALPAVALARLMGVHYGTSLATSALTATLSGLVLLLLSLAFGLLLRVPEITQFYQQMKARIRPSSAGDDQLI